MTVKEIERIGAPEISREDARRAFLEYRRAVTLESDPSRRAEYDGLMRGYKAIAKGQQVIDLAKTIGTAGLQEDTLYPRLAICIADATKCKVTLRTDGGATFCDAGDKYRWRAVPKSRRVELPMGTLPLFERKWRTDNNTWQRYRPGGILERPSWANEAFALVPIVPPHLHPRAALARYHIIWDAVWTAAPPVDPLLVRHLAGSLYAVVAHWDLTPLEQAVLRGRL